MYPADRNTVVSLLDGLVTSGSGPRGRLTIASVNGNPGPWLRESNLKLLSESLSSPPAAYLETHTERNEHERDAGHCWVVAVASRLQRGAHDV